MTDLLTAAQMRALEQRAMDSGRVTGADLMERAGQGVVAACFDRWPHLAQTPHSACVLCGPGNNGGDGFVIVRLLQNAGWRAAVFLLGAAKTLPPDARLNHDRWSALGPVQPLTAQALAQTLDQDPPDLVVDALFGAGLSRPLTNDTAQIVASLNQSQVPCVSVDAPSGLCLDSGRVLGERGSAVQADLTVSFDSPKAGHLLAEGPAHCGALDIRDIGLARWRRPDAALTYVTPDARSPMPWRDLIRSNRPAAQTAHKYTHGHVLTLTGGFGKTGAARLAARAALRAGAGLVTLAVPGSAQLEVACQITAEMMTQLETADDLHTLLQDPRLNSLILGPGLGQARARALVPAALGARRTTVLDADALSAFADAPDTLFQNLHPNCILTPHGGEFARLFPDLAAQITSPAAQGPALSRIDITRLAAARAGCLILLKGPDTVIADPSGAAAVHAAAYDRAAPDLATAGSGDVLAGLIAGLAAQGRTLFHAAQMATWLHTEAARLQGPGLIASDLPKAIPAVLARFCDGSP